VRWGIDRGFVQTPRTFTAVVFFNYVFSYPVAILWAEKRKVDLAQSQRELDTVKKPRTQAQLNDIDHFHLKSSG
jgi:hypothetical protein